MACSRPSQYLPTQVTCFCNSSSCPHAASSVINRSPITCGLELIMCLGSSLWISEDQPKHLPWRSYLLWSSVMHWPPAFRATMKSITGHVGVQRFRMPFFAVSDRAQTVYFTTGILCPDVSKSFILHAPLAVPHCTLVSTASTTWRFSPGSPLVKMPLLCPSCIFNFFHLYSISVPSCFSLTLLVGSVSLKTAFHFMADLSGRNHEVLFIVTLPLLNNEGAHWSLITLLV